MRFIYLGRIYEIIFLRESFIYLIFISSIFIFLAFDRGMELCFEMLSKILFKLVYAVR